MENNKIKKEINDIVNDNLKALEQLFPSAVKDGQLDIKALKEELGDFEEVTTEKYELNWAGKQNAKKMVQQGIGNKTLKFVEKDSKNADTTENIYIEGDNLEVLKLLRQNYYNSIKMIYIDPPYNTGNDFVYNDTFKIREEDRLIRYSGIRNLRDIELIVNCTPVGMFPQVDACPLEDVNIINTNAVVDIVYNPEETVLMKKYKLRNTKTANGLMMLISQAIKSEEIWNGEEYDKEILDTIYKKLSEKLYK